MALPILHHSWYGVELRDAYDVLAWIIRLGALAVVPFKRRTTAAAWLLFIFLLPVPGLLLFLAIGQPHFPKWHVDRFQRLLPYFEGVSAKLRTSKPAMDPITTNVAGLVERLGHLAATGGNGIELIDDYDGMIDRLVRDIEGARRSVRLLIYIFADDALQHLGQI